VRRGVVLADAAYGIDGQFRAGLTELELQYVVGVQSSMTVWAPGTLPLPARGVRPDCSAATANTNRLPSSS